MHGTKKPLVLTILDGWGFSPATEGNAIAAARKPTYDFAASRVSQHAGANFRALPSALPEGQMGNSEVGHLNIGAGRVIYMDVTRIDQMIALGRIFPQSNLLDACNTPATHRLHLMGLCSDGGVHSLLTHLYALLKMAKQRRRGTCVCALLYGRPRYTARKRRGLLEQIQQQMRQMDVGKIASVSGRYYAMDRDKRWDRIERAYARWS